MKKELEDLLRLEATDELIAKQKKYVLLGELYDKYESVIDFLGTLRPEPLFPGVEKELKRLEKLNDSISKEMWELSRTSQEQAGLQRMVKATFMLRAMK
jgi:hypothetical protein